MSVSILPLDSTRHRTHGWKCFENFRFASGDNLAPVSLVEVAGLLPFFPLAFMARPDSRYQLVAVQGLHVGENLLVDASGRWRAASFPSVYRLYPFVMREGRIGEEVRQMLCFNQASGLYREVPDPAQGEERFFDDEGKLQPKLQQRLTFMGTALAALEQTQCAVDALSEARVLTPWALPLDNPDPARNLVTGLYHIDQVALDGLDGATLQRLRDTQALPMAYAQRFSEPRVHFLRHFYTLSHPQPASPLPPTLDGLFGQEKNDQISFDWLNNSDEKEP